MKTIISYCADSIACLFLYRLNVLTFGYKYSCVLQKLLLIGLLWVPFNQCFSEIIPANRRIIWQNNIGIPGGIPTTITQWCDIKISIPGTNIVATGGGTIDDTASISAAINLCPSNAFIYFPPGTYYNNGTFTLKSGVVLRGAGMSQTVISGGMFRWALGSSVTDRDVYGIEDPVIPKGSSNLILGTNIVRVGNTITIKPGTLLWIGVTNDNVLIDPQGYEGNQSAVFTSFARKNMGQIVEVTSVNNSTNVTFWPPAVWSYSNSLGILVRYYSSVGTRSGIEDLTLLNRTRRMASMVKLEGAAYCWLKNVGIQWSYENAVYLRHAFRCEFRGCLLKNTEYITPGGGYGFRTDLLPSFNLIEDNIIEGLRASIIIEGGSGNVMSYNYIPWSTNYDNVLQKQLTFHASSPAFNLFEGNKATACGADNTHGSSIMNTFFRNYLTGTNIQGNSTIGSRCYNWTIRQDRKALYYNYVGNVFGIPGMKATYESSYATTINRANTINYIWTIGYQTDGSGSTNNVLGVGGLSFNYDTNSLSTLIRQYNYDYITGSNVIDNANVQDIDDSNIPPSLYLAEKPIWFGNLNWPPIGPDITNFTNMLPAQLRYLSITTIKRLSPPILKLK